jgi:hypothetical protein
MNTRIAPVLLAMSASAALVFGSISARAQTAGSPAKFTATAVNMSNTGMRGVMGQVEISVNRWSTDAENERLMAVLMDRGEKAFLDALGHNKSVGYFRPLTGIGFELRYAREEPLPEGGRRITIITDRPIGFAEATSQPATIDYPFITIELDINAEGKGEGTYSAATRIRADKESNIMVIENWADQPIRLTQVNQEKKKGR